MLEKSLLVRFNKKTVIYGILIIWLVVVNLWLYSYGPSSYYISGSSESSIYQDEAGETGEKHQDAAARYDVKNEDVRAIIKAMGIKDQRSIDSHSTVYDLMLQHHKLPDVLGAVSFNDRCDLYFKNLFINNKNWNINPDESLPLEHRYEYDFESYKNNVLGNVKEVYVAHHKLKFDEVKWDDPKVKDVIDRVVKEEFDAFWQKTMSTEQKMTDYLSHLRIFNKCYVTNDNKYSVTKAQKLINKEQVKVDSGSVFRQTPNEELIRSFDSCNELESRVYKWMSFAYPIYERWTGDIYLSPPDMKKFVSYPEVFSSSNKKFDGRVEVDKSNLVGQKPCFLNKFKNSLNGKGIVLSINDQHTDDTVKLIHLLRALNNHYPIQIVYYDSLSDESKRKIVNAGRNKMIDLPHSFKAVSDHFSSDYFNVNDGGLPRQEIWFVNTYNAIHNNYKDKFKGFANKFLATLFNSFSEIMLIDADTVLVQNPKFFFKLKNYVSKGAYFYKDRTAPEFRPEGDTKFFEKMTPSIIDHLMFDIPIVTRKTLGLEFFQGMGHYMESGLVMINRQLHFNSILTMIQLNFFNPVTTRVYGDKEIFWLGFAINGDEDFHFNKYFVAAIGEETPPLERLNEDGTQKKSREVCSAHPGHINGEDDKTLIWFNSGYKYCGQSEVINYEEEVEKGRRLRFLKDPNTMKDYYENPLSLKTAIIPPFKNKLETWAENTIGEPKQGWHMDKEYCNSYLWCAYSSIGGTNGGGKDTTQTGHVIDFDNKSVQLFKYYGDIWVGNE